MDKVHEYKCPCCGGSIVFDSNSQKMKCPFCDTEFETETLKKYDEELNNEWQEEMKWEETASDNWDENECESLRTYLCSSCGGEIIGDKNTAATICPFCDSPLIIMNQFSGSLKPELVIPFKLDKEQAKEKLKAHFKGKLLLPKVFKSENHIDEIKGLYVPFWLFDTDANAQIRYRATRVRSWRDRDYIYKETQFYSVFRAGSLGFSSIPVDGSSKIEDALMQSLEPFYLDDAVDFQTAYLSGYLADKYDVSATECVETVNKRVKTSTEKAFRNTVNGYATLSQENSNIQFYSARIKYALYPVWILNTTWKGKKYQFAMNGQTGKFVGNLPLDKKSTFFWLFGLTAAFSALICGFKLLQALLGK